MRLSNMFPSFALAFLLTLSGGLPGFQPMSSSAKNSMHLYAMSELEAGHGGHFSATAEINNRPVEVLVDTGASVVALSYEDAERIGLKPKNLKFDVKVNTANGVGEAAEVLLREVEIDGVRVSNVKGLVLQPGALQGTLLGMSFLSRLRSFSVQNGKLILKN